MTNTTLTDLREAFANPDRYEGHAAVSQTLAATSEKSRPLVRSYVLENSTSDWHRHQVLSWDREALEDGRLLRHVEVNLGSWAEGKGDKHTLLLWDTYTTGGFGQTRLGYRFSNHKGQVIFEAEDILCPITVAIDSDSTVRSMLTFLGLSPGDTDKAYFANYSKAQMAFAESKAEGLSMFASEKGGEPFINLDTFVSEWEVELHGIDHRDSFRGASQGNWRGIAVGVGMDEAEALECALDQLSDSHDVDGIDWEPGDLAVDLDAIATEHGIEVEDLEETPCVYLIVRVR